MRTNKCISKTVIFQTTLLLINIYRRDFFQIIHEIEKYENREKLVLKLEKYSILFYDRLHLNIQSVRV